jgi:anti-sigma-28 factor FlgM
MNRRSKRRRPGPDLPTTRTDETVTRLKQQFALGSYRVDADAVAREILTKLRLLGSGRRALLRDPSPGGGHTRTTSHD